MLINGEWIETKERLPVENPYTGEIVGDACKAAKGDVLNALKEIKKFKSELTAYERSMILENTAAVLQEKIKEYAVSICTESGLCINDATNEVKRAASLLKVYSQECKRITGENILTDITQGSKANMAVTKRVPVGLVCAITPFNRPLNQVVVKLAPAIAANNSVILKPSEKTPLTAMKFVKELIDCGLPQKMVSLVTGDPNAIGDTLIDNPYIDMVTFTGSSAVGEHIAKKAGMIRTAFELGDSGVLIVMDDADVEKAVNTAVSGCFGTAGQSCRGMKF